MFKIGQKVICVETAYEGSTIKGKTYIVDGIVECCECLAYLDGDLIGKQLNDGRWIEFLTRR